MEKHYFLLLVFIFGQIYPLKCMAQASQTMDMVYDLALEHSHVISQAMLARENAIMEYDNYKKGFLPQIELIMKPIQFNRSFKLLQNPLNGGFYNIDNYTNTSCMGIQLSKKIGITGGTLSLAHSVNMLNEISTGENKFTTVPLFIGYVQPLLGGRKTYVYQRNINDLKLRQANKDLAYVIAKEQQKLANLFVSIILKRNLFNLCNEEVLIADSLIGLGQQKYKEGHIALVDLYAVEAIKTERLLDRQKVKYDLDKAYLNWQKYIPSNITFPEELPIDVFPQKVDYVEELELYMKYNPSWAQSELSKEAASYKRYTDKLATQFNANISLNYGLNQYSERFANSFKHPLQCQNIELTLQIPIFQWGINRNKRRIADNEYKISELGSEETISQDKAALATLVLNYNYFRESITIMQSDLELSQKRYTQVRMKYDNGKIPLSDVFSLALDVMDKSRRLVVLMQSFYECYLDLRTLTLYDMASETPVEITGIQHLMKYKSK